jgi:hypothetical protein
VTWVFTCGLVVMISNTTYVWRKMIKYSFFSPCRNSVVFDPLSESFFFWKHFSVSVGVVNIAVLILSSNTILYLMKRKHGNDFS